MKNKKITRKITQGMYILTTNNGGCVVDAVSQISSGDNPLIAVSVMKSNYTNELMKNNNKFCLSVLAKNVNGEIIKTFGYNSTRDIDKFKDVEFNLVDDQKVIKDSLGYMICKKIDSIDNDTHTLFIGKLVGCDVFSNEEAMSYQYFQKNKDDLIKVTTEKGKTAWVCTVCGYVQYDEELDDNFTCPICGVPKDMFIKKES